MRKLLVLYAGKGLWLGSRTRSRNRGRTKDDGGLSLGSQSGATCAAPNRFQETPEAELVMLLRRALPLPVLMWKEHVCGVVSVVL